MSLESKFLSKVVNDLFWKEELTLSTAESCTGGMLSAAITTIPGSSEFFKGGIVAYSVEAKENLLGINPKILEEKGVVSEDTAIEMAKGAMKAMNSDCALATTGIAGPTGGTSETPIGTIWIAAVNGSKILTEKLEGDNGRELNVLFATEKALQLLIKLFQNQENEMEK